MNNESLIYKQLVMLSVALGQPQSKERLQIYTQLLKGYEVDRVLRVIEGFTTKSKFFPQPIELLEPLKGIDIPTDEIATIWANEIVDSFYRCGSTQDAERTLGEKYQIVVRMGGWEQLSRSDNGDIPTIKAQIRELAKAYINRSKRDAQDGIEPFKLDTSPRSLSGHKEKPGLKLVKFELTP